MKEETKSRSVSYKVDIVKKFVDSNSLQSILNNNPDNSENLIEKYRFGTQGELINRLLQARWIRTCLLKSGLDYGFDDFQEIRPSQILIHDEKNYQTRPCLIDKLLRNFGEFINEKGTKVFFSPREFYNGYKAKGSLPLDGLYIDLYRNLERTKERDKDFEKVVETINYFVRNIAEKQEKGCLFLCPKRWWREHGI